MVSIEPPGSPSELDSVLELTQVTISMLVYIYIEDGKL